MAVDQTKDVFDFALADDYKPIISRRDDFTPTRILVLPVTGPISDPYRQIFETEMLIWLRKPNNWTIVEYAPPGSGDFSLAVDRGAAYKRAKLIGADAVLFVELSDHEVYSPLRVAANVNVERVDTQSPVLNARFDFDTRNVEVADSARRYYQQHMARTFGSSDAPDKSRYILNNNEPYLKFAGYYTALLLNNTYAPPRLKSGDSSTSRVNNKGNDGMTPRSDK